MIYASLLHHLPELLNWMAMLLDDVVSQNDDEDDTRHGVLSRSYDTLSLRIATIQEISYMSHWAIDD
jgi:hypothetical protein